MSIRHDCPQTSFLSIGWFLYFSVYSIDQVKLVLIGCSTRECLGSGSQDCIPAFCIVVIHCFYLSSVMIPSKHWGSLKIRTDGRGPHQGEGHLRSDAIVLCVEKVYYMRVSCCDRQDSSCSLVVIVLYQCGEERL